MLNAVCCSCCSSIHSQHHTTTRTLNSLPFCFSDPRITSKHFLTLSTVRTCLKVRVFGQTNDGCVCCVQGCPILDQTLFIENCVTKTESLLTCLEVSAVSARRRPLISAL